MVIKKIFKKRGFQPTNGSSVSLNSTLKMQNTLPGNKNLNNEDEDTSSAFRDGFNKMLDMEKYEKYNFISHGNTNTSGETWSTQDAVKNPNLKPKDKKNEELENDSFLLTGVLNEKIKESKFEDIANKVEEKETEAVLTVTSGDAVGQENTKLVKIKKKNKGSVRGF